MYGNILDATRRDGAIFPQSCVAVRLWGIAPLRSQRLDLQKNGRRRGKLFIVNTT